MQQENISGDTVFLCSKVNNWDVNLAKRNQEEKNQINLHLNNEAEQPRDKKKKEKRCNNWARDKTGSGLESQFGLLPFFSPTPYLPIPCPKVMGSGCIPSSKMKNWGIMYVLTRCMHQGTQGSG